MAYLEAAQEWGRPPWELFGGNQLTWMIRWEVLRVESIKSKARKAALNG